MTFTNDSTAGRLIHTTHVDNLRGYIGDGQVHCPADRDPAFREIWSLDIARRRAQRGLPFGGLALGNCTSFHLCPKTPAHFGIATGYGTARVSNTDIVHLETSVAILGRHMMAVAVSDRNLLARDAQVTLGADGLKTIDWQLILSGQFSRDPTDPSRVTRAAAEVITRGSLPFAAIEKIVCWNETTAGVVADMVREIGICVVVDTSYFFKAGE